MDAARGHLTGQRAARLFRLLTLLGDGPLTRPQILRKLRIDVRGFYRDLEALRGLGIEVYFGDDNRYGLAIDLDEAPGPAPLPRPRPEFPRRPATRQRRDRGPPQAQAAAQLLPRQRHASANPEQAT